MWDDDWAAEAMSAVFEHYELPYPQASTGQRSIRCPVHDESNASATVNLEKGVFYCFACGASGNAAHIVMAREGLEVRDAFRYIEEVVGVSDNGVRRSVRGKPGRGVHAEARDKRRTYVPSWLRDR